MGKRLTPMITQVNLKNVVLNERSQTSKSIYRIDSTYIKKTGKMKL